LTVLLNTVPPPFGDRVANPLREGYATGTDPLEGLMDDRWVDYMSHQATLAEKFAGRVANVVLSPTNASIAKTDLTDGTLGAGLYRLSYFVHVTSADFGGTLQVILTWASAGAALTYTGVALPTNANTDYQSGGVSLMYVDALSPVEYEVVYTPSFNGAEYVFYAVLEEVQA